MAKQKAPSRSKKKKHGPETVAMKRRGAKVAVPNPFDAVRTRTKFFVLGKKPKGASRNVGETRAAAGHKRKATLVEEYNQRGKSNVFLDRRFGERDEGLTEDDKAILRFQRERQAQMNRRSKFTLADDDDDVELLTHKGAVLSSLDDFKDDVPGDDDEDAARGEDAFEELRFGGGVADRRKGGDVSEGDGEHRKTKKEVMEEVMAKSKFYKAQKAREREEDEDLKVKLDKDFAVLAQSQALLSLVRPKKGAADLSSSEKAGPDDYGKLMKEMVFDMRARASDRLKTPEELAEEEKARLEELEMKRRKRMLGEETSESEGDSKDDGARRKRKRREISGDALSENFVLEEEEENEERGWVDEVLARKGEEEGSDEEDGSDDDSGSEGSEGVNSDAEEDDEDESEDEIQEKKDWEQSDDENVDLEDAAKAINESKVKSAPADGNDRVVACPSKGPDGDNGLTKSGRKKAKRGKGEAPLDRANELPFVIEAPKTLEDFRQLVDNRSDEDLLVVVHRIRTCNAISLHAENRQKMQVFYGVLVQYFAVLASDKSLPYSRLNVLTNPLIELGSETPYFAALCARQRLVRMQKLLSDKLRNPDGTNCWPSVRTLLLLRLWSMNFPPSDFRHAVMTPAMLLMSEYLIRCPVLSGRDVAVGSFLCSLVLSVMRPARRFCPEALNFMYALLLSALPSSNDPKKETLRKYCPAFVLQLVGSKPWLLLETKKPAVENLDFVSLMTSEDTAAVFSTDTFRVGILHAILHTLKGFISIYEDLSSFPELFKPFILLVTALAENKELPEKLLLLLTDIRQTTEAKVKEQETLRQPLRMRTKKPVPIKQYNPRFEDDFAAGRDYDVDRERAEKKKLLRQIKRETKGAAREIRKDNHLLQVEKVKERAAADEERKEKYNKAMAFLQEQEHAFKSGQLGKGRKKKRR